MKHLFVIQRLRLIRSTSLVFCTKYITLFSKYGIELIVALPSTNAQNPNQSLQSLLLYMKYRKHCGS